MSRQRVNRQPQGLQEILAQDLTGVDRRQFGSLALHLNILLVVVGEFHFVSITAIPAKADCQVVSEDLTGVDRRQFGSLALHLNILLVVVGEFNFVSITAIPAKADSILVIHANTVLPGSVPLEGFEPIAWWNSQVVERRRPMQQTQTAQRNSSDRLPAARHVAVEEHLRIAIAKRSNHPPSIMALVIPQVS